MKMIIICNWKNYIKTDVDAVSLIKDIKESKIKTIVCPSSIHISSVSCVKKKNIFLGAQDIGTSDPHTGRLSGEQLKEYSIEYVIVGHKETRASGVTNKIVSKKIENAQKFKIKPIICLSEQEVNEDNDGDEVISQLKEIISLIDINDSIIAYEPTAYIGSDKTLNPNTIKTITSKLKTILKENNLNIPVLYGGSVNKDTIKNILDIDIEGFLLGRVSVNSKELNQIIDICRYHQ